jgi:polyhydroxyalkanoate synthase
MVARPLDHRLSVYDTALQAVREWAERDVTVRSWLAVSKWGDDAAPFPGETFRRWGDFYQRDKLIKGKMRLRGERVDISNIGCAVLNVSGKWDCTVPPSQTKATTSLASSPDKEYVSVNAGHVGMLVGPAAEGSLWPRLRDWLAPRSG